VFLSCQLHNDRRPKIDCLVGKRRVRVRVRSKRFRLPREHYHHGHHRSPPCLRATLRSIPCTVLTANCVTTDGHFDANSESVGSERPLSTSQSLCPDSSLRLAIRKVAPTTPTAALVKSSTRWQCMSSITDQANLRARLIYHLGNPHTHAPPHIYISPLANL